jgi:hypothetical protein
MDRDDEVGVLRTFFLATQATMYRSQLAGQWINTLARQWINTTVILPQQLWREIIDQGSELLESGFDLVDKELSETPTMT